jgi:asparagine synthase (glutamine-hydrolysing)
MCGIAGYVGTRGLAPARIAACLDVMRRRGPDDAGYRQWTGADGRRTYLLNSRLSIIDLDPRANQPFARGPRAMTYNGEIYNFVELRDQLSRDGAVWQTRSDTEVLLAAIERWGDDAWDRLEGMWAAAIFDQDTGALTLSRDRFGEKPLYLFEDESGLYFGSEPKCIAALLGRRLTVNVQHLHRFLVNGYRSLYKTGETFFENLRELSPGTWLRLQPGEPNCARAYWQPQGRPDEAMTREDAVSGVREHVVRAVALRLRADVPLAFCLSGGVDSNVLAAVAARRCGFAVHGFTVVDDDPRYDEREMVRASVAELGIRHTEVPTAPGGFLERLRALVSYHDAPVYTIAYMAHSLLMERIAAAGYRIAVSGTAADEILSGYYDHHVAFLAVMHGGEGYGAARDGWERRVRPFVRNPHLGDPDLFVRDPAFRAHVYFGAEGYAEYLVAPWSEAFAEVDYDADLLRGRMWNELRHETVPVILHEDDANAMYWSIENRSPYLDRELVDFCGTIPTRHLISDGYAKSLLRDAMRGVVPAAVLDNPRKVGFNAPIESFLDTCDPAVREWLLDDSPIYRLVRRERIAELIGRGALPNSDSKFLFSFVSSKVFLEEFSA